MDYVIFLLRLENFMKKRNLLLIFIVGLVGLFLPKGVFALNINNFETRLYMDYRFFVENQDDRDEIIDHRAKRKREIPVAIFPIGRVAIME